MSEWVWFAPGGDLSSSFRVGQGAGAGLVAHLVGECFDRQQLGSSGRSAG